jgi:hypothetical protein
MSWLASNVAPHAPHSRWVNADFVIASSLSLDNLGLSRLRFAGKIGLNLRISDEQTQICWVAMPVRRQLLDLLKKLH